MTLLRFAPYRPDRAALNSDFSQDVLNVLPSPDGYIPWPKFVPLVDAMADASLGGITAIDDNGGVHVFVGTADKLWKLDTTDNEFDDVSQTATTYTASALERWRFAQFGEYVVAVNINDAPQVFQLGTSTEFADLGGSPPNFRGVAVWGDYLAGWDDQNTIYWSDTNDITEWSTGNSGSQTFPDGFQIMGSNSVTNPFIVQKRGIRAATYVPGSVEVFTFQKIHEDLGAEAPYSVCSRGATMFFAGAGAFYMLRGDGSPVPIGDEKVDRTWFSRLSGPSLAAIMGETDPFYPRVYFSLQVNSTDDSFDVMLVYDWSKEEWSVSTQGTGILFPLGSATIGYTLDALDALFPGGLDSIPFSLDSNVFKGGAPIMGAMSAGKQFGFFSGDNAAATITTQEAGASTGQFTYLDGVYPVVDANQFTVSIGTRNLLKDDVSWSAEQVPNAWTGNIDFISEARFFSFRMTLPEGANWTKAQGVDVPGRPTGWR